MAKIWAKDYELDSLIEHFTVGSDYLLDRHLVACDCVASIAQATMLNTISILTDQEFEALKKELISIIKDNSKGAFSISIADEDCHTAIENRLIYKTGDAGKKIHTGRSRNDQVQTALRLYSKAFLIALQKSVLSLGKTLLDFASAHVATPMPGRTHMQIAMPSSVGLWAGSFAEDLLDTATQLSSLYRLIDQNPLGSAASYGVPLPLDREMTSTLMGFDRVQNNVLYANNSRGRFESRMLDESDQIMLTLSKMAQDLILFSLPEFGYFSLPQVLCSGSSIMPQKKNPDGLELIRAKAATMSAYAVQVKNIIRSLPSGYNRDFQETKEPFIRGAQLVIESLSIMELTISKLLVNEDKLRAGFTPEIYATDKALDYVLEGMSFRDAYKMVGLDLDNVKKEDPFRVIQKRNSIGTSGNLNLSYGENLFKTLNEKVVADEQHFKTAIEKLVGFSVELFSI